MKLKTVSTAADVLRAKWLGRRKPLFVSWIVTNRCNCRCAGCGAYAADAVELGADEALALVDSMADAGVRRLSLTGGEPLLREDIGRIIARARGHDIAVTVNSNGSLVAAKIEELKGIKALVLSLDGPESVHDGIRGRGSYAGVMTAVEAARANGIRVVLTATITRDSAGELPFFLSTAESLKTPMYFQPSEMTILRGSGTNPLAPAPEQFRTFIDGVLAAKGKNRWIASSRAGLRMLRNWPDNHRPVNCAGGVVFCRVDADGTVRICGKPAGARAGGNVRKEGFARSFVALVPCSCLACWCASRVEFNLAFGMNPDAAMNIARR